MFLSQELHDVPLHHTLDQMCSTLHCNMPNMLAFRLTTHCMGLYLKEFLNVMCVYGLTYVALYEGLRFWYVLYVYFHT